MNTNFSLRKTAAVLTLSIALLLLLCLPAFAQTGSKSGKTLDMYFIDVEGGQATLIVDPAGESMLVDTGYPGFNGRDAGRILSAAKAAGLRKIDVVVISHYHLDHVGGAAELAQLIKIGSFVDHGPNQEDTSDVQALYSGYQKLREHYKHRVLQPGDQLPFKGMKVQVLTAAGEHINSALPGAGQPNPFCSGAPEPPVDRSENARSLGTLITYGKFRLLDLADLTKKKELELACPNNLIGTVDLYLVNHHGLDQSNAAELVHALHPRVAIMNNGPHKGGKPEAWKTVHDSPGLEDLWQLHYSVDAGRENNVSDNMIANPDEKCQGAYIKVSARSDGTFTVLNSRNQYSKTYSAK
jgi:competence protein ComEC